MNIIKTVGKLAKNHTVLFTVVAAVALMYVMKTYSIGKGLGIQGFQGDKKHDDKHKQHQQHPVGLAPSSARNAVPLQHPLNPLNPPIPAGNNGAIAGTCGQGTNYKPSQGLGRNETNAAVSGLNTDTYGLPPSCAKQSVVDPRQLLPKDVNTSFSQMNPAGAGDIQNVSLLKAGYHIGINTVGQSLRNANLQLRSEPANPQLSTGPWNQSSIGPDLNRRALEVGCHSGK